MLRPCSNSVLTIYLFLVLECTDNPMKTGKAGSLSLECLWYIAVALYLAKQLNCISCANATADLEAPTSMCDFISVPCETLDTKFRSIGVHIAVFK